MQAVAGNGGIPMRQDARSTCPISTALELVGDRWSLLIVRDMMFAGKRHFREFLLSDEGIASNILAGRLQALVAAGILTRDDDPSHRQKAVYSLTEMGISLLPVIVAMSSWSQKHFPHTRRAEAMAVARGGEPMRRQLAAALRKEHVRARGQPPARA